MTIRRLLTTIGYCLRFTSTSRANYARRKKIFWSIGEDVRLPLMNLPLYPKLISFHNNIEVASGVKFIVHDAIHGVLNRDPNIAGGGHFAENMGCIEVMDNVFIGAGTMILPNVRIGPNAIIGAGSVVNKDVPANSVCVGVPAKQVGTYEEYYKNRASEVPMATGFESVWREFLEAYRQNQSINGR